MMIARLSDGRFVLGVDAENIKRLTSGMPMILDLANFGGTDTALLVYGPTLGDVMSQLERALGEKLPPAQPLPPKGGAHG